MTREHGGMLRGIAEHKERRVAGMDGEHGMARRVAGRRQGDDAGRDLLARLELRHLPRDIGKNAPLIEES